MAKYGDGWKLLLQIDDVLLLNSLLATGELYDYQGDQYKVDRFSRELQGQKSMVLRKPLTSPQRHASPGCCESIVYSVFHSSNSLSK